VLTDIGGDPDDQQSLARLMLYANEFEIEGLLTSASGTPGELKTRVVQTPLIREIVEAYGQVRDNLALHADGYPTTQYLLDRVKTGNPNRGVGFIGAGHDTEASRWIVAVVDRADPRPVDITIWGGQTDLAQALWRVREERGRFSLARDRLYRDARDKVGDVTDARATVWRWRPAFQADFQARMDWCLKPVAQANHPPTPVLNGDRTRNVLEYEIKAGEALRLSAAGSFDPDGDRLSFRWFIYPEAGSYGHAVPIDNPIAATVSLTVPADAADKTIHLVLEVTDNGAPPLTRYRRAVVHARK